MNTIFIGYDEREAEAYEACRRSLLKSASIPLHIVRLDQAALRRDTGIVFAVRHLEADYLRPAVFDDWLTVTTAVRPITGTRIVLSILLELRRRGKRYGVASACIGGGQGIALVLERV